MRAWHEDSVERILVLNPMYGTVNKINIRTLGGVIKPAEPIMEIILSGEILFVKANIIPHDIIFIYPGQDVTVKITANDFSKQKGLEATVEHISMDTITDEECKKFYQINARTEKAHLSDKSEKLPIIPGMVAEIDIYNR